MRSLRIRATMLATLVALGVCVIGQPTRLATAQTSDRELAPKPKLLTPADLAAMADDDVIDEIRVSSEVGKNLQYLCDTIGPRVTGSPRLERANRWAAEKMKSYGLENVTLEPWEIPIGWERVSCQMKIVEPDNGRTLTAAAVAWTPSTKGKVTGPVVVFDVKTRADLDKFKGKLKNAIVLRNPPADIRPVTDLTYLSPAPRSPSTVAQPKKEAPKASEPKDPPAKEPKDQPAPKEPKNPGKNGPDFRKELNEFLRAEGAACLVLDSAKPHGLLTMTGRWTEGDRGAQDEVMPSVFMAHEHYRMLYRLATATNGTTPLVEVEIVNKFSSGPVTVFNTVGEIRGKTKPDEFVVIGAHLDSWDLGSGATDNGTGSCVVLEVARTLAKLAKQGNPPDRTIRFVLFTGEEQGLFGSKQYVKRHESEMAKTSMALVHDTGTGKVISMNLMNREAVKSVLDVELVSLKKLEGWQGVNTRSSGGTDHLSFEQANVPGFACQQDMDEYRLTHHTQTDTFDHVKVPNLVQGAQVIAVTALRVANLPTLLPREKPEVKKESIKK